MSLIIEKDQRGVNVIKNTGLSSAQEEKEQWNSPTFWWQKGNMELIRFLSEASWGQHDAAVYDTGYEFDPDNIYALRFIALIARAKFKDAIYGEIYEAKRNYGFVFASIMPQDGSVVPRCEAGKAENKDIREFAEHRKQLEDAALYTYIPDANKYCEAVEYALNNTFVSPEHLTPEERAERDRDAKWSSVMYNIKYYGGLAIKLGLLALYILGFIEFIKILLE